MINFLRALFLPIIGHCDTVGSKMKRIVILSLASLSISILCVVTPETTHSKSMTEEATQTLLTENEKEFRAWRSTIPDYEKRLYDRVKKINKRTIRVANIIITSIIIYIIVSGTLFFIIYKTLFNSNSFADPDPNLSVNKAPDRIHAAAKAIFRGTMDSITGFISFVTRAIRSPGFLSKSKRNGPSSRTDYLLPSLLISAGLFFIFLFFKNQTHEYSQFIFVFLFIIILLLFLLSITLFYIRYDWSLNLSISFFTILICLFFLEIGMLTIASHLPVAVQKRYFDGDILDIQMDKLIFFDHPPYVKFKPNTCIDKGDKLNEGNFVDRWCTDSRGYKNLPSVLDNEKITFTAAGDSFIEGLGVRIDKTWAALLNQRGIPTYSLGVQGRSPKMAVESIKHFGMDLNSSFLSVGCSFCVLGDYSYHDPETGYQLGNLVQYINAELRAQDRIQYKLLVSASIHAGLDQLLGLYPDTGKWLHFPIDWNASSFRQLVVQKIRQDPRHAPIPKSVLETAIDIPDSAPDIIRQYENEIRIYASNTSTKEKMLADPSWQRISAAFLELKKVALESDARPSIIYTPHRGVLLYKAFVGKFPENNVLELDRIILKEFCETNDIDFIDLTEPMISYIMSIGPHASIWEYPYFKFDGHYNEIGQVIMADAIESYIKQHQ